MSCGSPLRDCRNYAVNVHGMTKTTLLRLTNWRTEVAVPTSRRHSATSMLPTLSASVPLFRPWLIATLVASGFALIAELHIAHASDEQTLAPIVDDVPDSSAVTRTAPLDLRRHVLVPTKPTGNRRNAPALLSSESVADAKDLQDAEATEAKARGGEVNRIAREPSPALSLKSFVKTAPVARQAPTTDSAAAPAAEPIAFERSVFLATVGDRLERSTPSDVSVDAEDEPLVAQLLTALQCLAYVEPTAAPSAMAAAAPAEKVAVETPESEPAASGIAGFVKPATTAPPELVKKPRNPFQHLFVPAALAKRERQLPTIVATTDLIEHAAEASDGVLEQSAAPASTQLEPVGPVSRFVALAEPRSVDFLGDSDFLAEAVHLPGLNVPESQLLASNPMLVDVAQPTTPRADDAESVAAPEPDGLKPIGLVSTRIVPESGEMPRDYATSRFAGAGEVRHSMGVSRGTEAQFNFNWEAPALCHRALLFEEVNLERYGYKVPLVQPALSAAHFFGRVPLAPYLMAAEGSHRCTYTLGHCRPGDDAPYYWHVPPWQWRAGMLEAAAVAGVFFAFP